MAELSDAYVGSSCLVTGTRNEVFVLGAIKKVGKTFIDIGFSHSKLPIMPYGYLVKLEVHNIYLGLRVYVGSVYLSTTKMTRITIIEDVTSSQYDKCFQVKVDEDGVIYNCMRGDELLGMDDNGHGYNGLRVKVMSVGVGGLKFRTTTPLRPGDWFNIMIPTMERVVLFCCIVRSYVELAIGERAFICDFMEMEESQEEILYKYLLKHLKKQIQRQLERKRKK